MQLTKHTIEDITISATVLTMLLVKEFLLEYNCTITPQRKKDKREIKYT